MKNNKKILKKRLKELVKSGVEIEGEEVYISPDCIVESGVRIISPCHITNGAHIREGAVIYPFSYIQGSVIGKNAQIRSSTVIDSEVGAFSSVGPYAYLRMNARIGEGCRIGDFVEIKNSAVGNFTNAAHLAYVGDASVGNRVNVGCGVVFANYDGQNKYISVVQDDCFIGCNCNIVAPVVIKRGAYIAAGTTVTRSLDEDDFCIGRSRERIIGGGGEGRYKKIEK